MSARSSSSTFQAPRPRHEPLFEPLAASDLYDEAEVAIVQIIAPVVEALSSKTHITGLLKYKGNSSILVGTSDPSAVRAALEQQYGAIPVIVCLAEVSVIAAPPAHSGTQRRSLQFAMGGSISQAGSSLTGSLGPIVQKKTTKEVCAVTAYHVVRASSAAVVCPGDGDAESMPAEEEDYLARERSILATYVTEGKALTSTQTRIAKSERTCDLLRNHRTFGQICKTSYRLPTRSDPSYSDCALIAITHPERLSLDSVSYDIGARPTDAFTDPMSLAPEHRLYIPCRTSGVVSAETNGYRFWTELETFDGQLTLPFWCHAAWNRRGNAVTDFGDSGAAVVNAADGSVVGLVVGGVVLQSGDISNPTAYRADFTLFQSIMTVAGELDIEPLDRFNPIFN